MDELYENIEVRDLIEDIEIRANAEGEEVIAGYAIVFNRESEDLGGFKETIDPGAVAAVDFRNTVATFNHNPNNVLGRVPLTMTYQVDDRGVYVEIKPPDTAVGRDLVTLVKRKDVRGMSFTFRVGKDGDKWDSPTGANKLYKRTVTKIDAIPELGPVVFPAYRATNVAVAKRALGILKDAEEREATDALEKARELDEIKIKNYHRALKLKIKTRSKK